MILNPDNPQAKEFSIDDKGRVMNRREQIEEAADIEPSCCKRCWIAGAEWADATNIITEINLKIQQDNSILKRLLSQTKACLDVAVGALEKIKSEDTYDVFYAVSDTALAKIAELQKEKVK